MLDDFVEARAVAFVSGDANQRQRCVLKRFSVAENRSTSQASTTSETSFP